MDEKEKEIAALRAIYDEEKKVSTCYMLCARAAYAYAMHMRAPMTRRGRRSSPPPTPQPAAAQGCGDCAVPSS